MNSIGKKNRKKNFQHLTLYLFTAGVVLGLKYHYSRATIDDLDWIIRPTASLVEFIGDKNFIKESGSGYVSIDDHAMIAPSCAGVNFLITAFSMTAFLGFYHLKRLQAKIVWLSASLALAYLLTVHVNAVRIILSIYLYQADIYSGWISPERIHLATGCVIYFMSLSIFYLGLRTILEKRINKTTRIYDIVFSGFIPLCWYFLFVLGIPLINHASSKNRSLFFEHYGIVFSLSIVVFIMIFLIRLICYHTDSRMSE